jgi:hypothetical protein
MSRRLVQDAVGDAIDTGGLIREASAHGLLDLSYGDVRQSLGGGYWYLTEACQRTTNMFASFWVSDLLVAAHLTLR